MGAEIIERVCEQEPDALDSPARQVIGAKHVPIHVAELLKNTVLPQVEEMVRI